MSKRMTIVIVKLLIILLAIVLCIFAISVHKTKDINEVDPDVVRKMNSIELHYDADGPFVIIDQLHKVIGYYDASTPIYHAAWYDQNIKLEDGVYKLYNIDDTALALMNNDDETVIHWNLKESEYYLLNTFSKPCPVLVLTDWIITSSTSSLRYMIIKDL